MTGRAMPGVPQSGLIVPGLATRFAATFANAAAAHGVV
jgi:hypothetical protein